MAIHLWGLLTIWTGRLWIEKMEVQAILAPQFAGKAALKPAILGALGYCSVRQTPLSIVRSSEEWYRDLYADIALSY